MQHATVSMKNGTTTIQLSNREFPIQFGSTVMENLMDHHEGRYISETALNRMPDFEMNDDGIVVYFGTSTVAIPNNIINAIRDNYVSLRNGNVITIQ